MIKRRTFIAGLGGAAAWPVVAPAQSGDRMRRVGALIGVDEGDTERQGFVAAFRKTLQELGWTEGRNLRIDLRWAANDRSRARAYAAELVAINPDALFGDNTFVIEELKQATRTLPIIFAKVTDPIGYSLTNGLASPGGNITGFTDREISSLGKLVEIIREIAPNIMTAGFITDSPPAAPTQYTVAAASSAGLRSIVAPVQTPREIEDAIVALGKQPNAGIILTSGPFTVTHRKLIIELVARHKLPTVYAYNTYVKDGGLISYGPGQSDQYRGAARYVDRILRGEKPADLPVQLPIKYELVINLKTAKALGLTIPETLLATADEVIE
jgi:putative ABC transport system substrate-binding protein